jgi:predicted RND superfamily exporter protein
MRIFLDRWVTTMLRFRLTTLALVGLVTLGAIGLIAQAEIRTDLMDMITTGSDRTEFYHKMRRIFGSDQVVLVGIKDDQLSAPAGIERLRNLGERFAAMPLTVPGSVVHLGSLERVLVGDDGAIDVLPYIGADPSPEQVRIGVEALRADGLFVPSFFSEKGDATVVLFTLVDSEVERSTAVVQAKIEEQAKAVDKVVFGYPLPIGTAQLATERGRRSLLEGARAGVPLKVRQLARAAGYRDEQIFPAGMAVSGAFLIEETERHVGPFFLATLAIIALLLMLMLRTVRAVFMCLIVAMPAVAWSIGFGSWLNDGVSIVAAMAPMIVLVLSVANVIHLVGQYRMERARRPQREAIIVTFTEVGTACFLTSLTTLIGFSSLKFIPLGTAQELGIVCSIGVVASFVLSFSIVPILLSYFDLKPAEAKDSKVLYGLLDGCLRLARDHSVKVITGGAAVTVLAVAGLNLLVIDTNLDAKFYDDHPIQQSVRFFQDNLAGGVGAEIIIDTGQPGGVLEADQFIEQAAKGGGPPLATATAIEDDGETFGFEDDEEVTGAAPPPQRKVNAAESREPNSVLTRLAQLTDDLQGWSHPDIFDGKPVINQVFSVVDVAERMHRASGGEGRLPNRAQFASHLALFEGESSDGLSPFLDKDRRYARIQLRLPSLGSRNAVAVMEYWEPRIQALFPTPQGAEPAQMSGVELLLSEVVETLGVRLYNGFAFAAFVITLVMGFVFRSIKVGAASMLPNILPVISGIGVLGLLGMQIDIDALFMVAIALGIAVDDTIHFLTRYKHEIDAGKSTETAVGLALRETGLGILRTSLVLILGFGVFLFSPYLTFKYIGLILPVTMMMAVLADMLVVPAMIFLGWIPVGRPQAAEQ